MALSKRDLSMIATLIAQAVQQTAKPTKKMFAGGIPAKVAAPAKRKVGRPCRLADGTRSTESVIFACSPSEKLAVQQRAARAGLSVARYVRSALGFESTRS